MEYLGLSYLGAGIGAGLVVLGAAYGIGTLAVGALEGMARQPEMGGDLKTTMIIAAALIEGLGFFALIVTFMLAIQKPKEGGQALVKPHAAPPHAAQPAPQPEVK
jgi:F-type H+-transporting ATPase subunit c